MKYFIALLSLVSSISAWACSFQSGPEVDRYYTNILITEVAQEFNISLVQATQLSLTGLTMRLHGVVPGSSCEAFMEHKARVVIKYQPTLTQKCELSVDVELQEDIHAETYPYQTYTFHNPASSCVKVRPIIRQPQFPRLPN